ncbi:MAG: glycosyltransferase [Candidatus Marinimicrobia bacterium]|nr:glycosyltransferase [Candidatus Neomarinimicrobiota bacterium]MCF7828043.1 glycosyltransferase [Candidatus Neomarinimicrobiota bacterium]MCF7879202.1 glycosyltransferase [Candidatus Neomarinimicrobiota bacterium]
MTENSITLDSYEKYISKSEINIIKNLAEKLGPAKIQQVNSTRMGGGVAEILHHLIPLMEGLDFEIHWDVIEGNPEFFNVTKKFHNALHGTKSEFSQAELDTFREVTAQNQGVVREDMDFYVMHDPQPVGLIDSKQQDKGRWIWRCHIDLSEADNRVWGFLRQWVDEYDHAIFHLPEYAKGLLIDQVIIPPAINPFSDKNRDLTDEEIASVLERFEIDPELPIILQVSRFDRLKDPVGVIKAYKLVRRYLDCQLILAGGSASDDPEGAEVLREVREEAGDDPNIHILNLPPDSNLEINAFQRAASVILQKSLREGFGLTVTEAMWKGKPVIGGKVGGIRRQIMHRSNGMLVQSIEGTALRIREILADPILADHLGENARKYVQENFLLPHYLKNWLLVFHSVRDGHDGIVRL